MLSKYTSENKFFLLLLNFYSIIIEFIFNYIILILL